MKLYDILPIGEENAVSGSRNLPCSRRNPQRTPSHRRKGIERGFT